MKHAPKFAFFCLALIALVAFSGQAFAAHYAQVGVCTPPNIPTHTYATIQAAVSASTSTTIIEICPGNYYEQIAIDKNLTLEGVNPSAGAVVIWPPATGVVANATDVDSGTPIAAQVLVQDSAAVTISNLTVDGTGNAVNDSTTDLMGILFQNASGTVNHVAVRNQLPDDTLQGDSGYGQGIYVQTTALFTSKVTVENSSVHGYNKNGITGNDAGTTLNVTGSYIQGAGALPNGFDAQNGIQLGWGAMGKISGNTVIDNSYVGTYWAASGILLYDAAEGATNAPVVTVTSNMVGNSQFAIALVTDTAGIGDYGSVTGNKILGTSTYDAIDLCTNFNTATGNTIFNSAESAVHLDASCPNTGWDNVATGNTILESACAGILDDSAGAYGNSYGTETYYTVPFPVAYSASACTIPGPEVLVTHARTTHKFSPKK
jgi:hypothetical protein